MNPVAQLRARPFAERLAIYREALAMASEHLGTRRYRLTVRFYVHRLLTVAPAAPP